jgi:hypothetical protein
VWFNGAAFASGVLPVVLACTVPDRGSVADPYCVRHCYTLVHEAGPAILGYVGAPAVISLVLFALLHRKGTIGSHLADRAAWSLAILSCLISLVGLTSAAGVEMFPVAALTIWTVVTAPSGPSPTRVDPSPRHPLPDAARDGYR